MKAKYCPCLGVKLGAVDRGDIGDFGLVGLEPGGIDEGILVRKHIEKPCGIGGSFCALGDDGKTSGPANSSTSGRHASQGQLQRSTPQSSLTTAIAGRNSTSTNNPSTQGLSRFAQQRVQASLPFKHTVTQIADLVNVHKDVWALAWDPNGQILMSNGSDGITKMWKQSIMNGEWMLFADQEISIESGDEGEEDGVTSKPEA